MNSLPKAIYKQQIIRVLGCAIWNAKITDVLASCPDTTAYFSRVAPLYDVHETPNDMHSPLLSPAFSSKRLEFDLMSTSTHICTHRYIMAWMDHIWKPSDRQAGDGAKASCSCPTSAQLSETRAAFEQPITPTQHRGKAISSRGAPLSHQMVWEMNRAIILVLDNSSDEGN